MKYSYNWLKELSDTKLSPEKLKELLTLRSFEVESLEKSQAADDHVLNIDILPNRAHDCLSYVGVAREISALGNNNLGYDYDGLKLPGNKLKKLKVEIQDKDLCSRYIGAVMENISIKESPDWLKERLVASDIRPINNVVDATNYVMLELGQPMHAFSATEITGAKIIVRRAKKGEIIKLLDETEKILDNDSLVIADQEKAIALAGIKGGAKAEIKPETKTIILESANFNAVLIRKTRTKLGLKTDASDRFEKEIDPNLAEKAMVRAIEILEHIADGKLEGVIDEYPKVVKPWKIKLNLDNVNSLLGENIPAKRSVQILNSLGLKISGKNKEIMVEVPTFRIDLKTSGDMTEEIGRVYGYENIKAQPLVGSLLAGRMNKERFFERKIKDILTGLKFDEVYNYSFYGRKDANSCSLNEIKHLELANPMNPDQQLMRVSLIPNLLKNIRDNLRNYKSFNLFENGRVYWPNGDALPEERKIIAMAVVLEQDKNTETFFVAKGAASDLLDKLGIKNIYFDNFDPAPANSLLGLWHPARSAEIKIEGRDENIGYIGEINPLILPLYKINKRVAMVELDLEKIMQAAEKELKFKSLQKYPTVVRDISMLADKKIKVAEIIRQIKISGGEMVLDVHLFDVFEKEGKNSFAFHIEIGTDERTLTGEEIDAMVNKVIFELKKVAEIRM